MSKKLTEIRTKIDALDNQIHDALIARADLVMEIAEEKRKKNLQTVHPAREAMMIRRLLERHKGDLPQKAILSIWRELVGAVCMMQAGLKVVVAEDESFSSLWDMAKDYFGSVMPMISAPSKLTAISAVRENSASFAVLPWPHKDIHMDGEEPWWSYLFHVESEQMRVIAALPFGHGEENFIAVEKKGLIVSKIDFLPSGSDHSLIVLEIDPEVSRGRIVDALPSIELTPLAIYTRSGMDNNVPSVHLIVIDDYVSSEDARLADIAGLFPDFESTYAAIGGYAVPPKIKSLKSSNGVI